MLRRPLAIAAALGFLVGLGLMATQFRPWAGSPTASATRKPGPVETWTPEPAPTWAPTPPVWTETPRPAPTPLPLPATPAATRVPRPIATPAPAAAPTVAPVRRRRPPGMYDPDFPPSP